MNFFVTGATGLLGRYLLLELLNRGHGVWALFRDRERRAAVASFLQERSGQPTPGSLRWIEGDVTAIDRSWPQWERQYPELRDVDHLLHSAASLRFYAHAEGEPFRSNVGGAEALTRLVAIRPLQVHLVSTAYVCGLVTAGRVREVNHPRGHFVNAYEESKWEAEQIWAGRATILRPGVIVGEYASGHTASFTGWYLIAQGGYLLDQFLKTNPVLDRHKLDIRVPIDPKATLNVAPVDYVARAAVKILEDPVHHNGIYHLTHPDPPSHAFSHRIICRYFDLGGIEFVDPATALREPDDPLRSMVWRQTRRFHDYFSSNPVFDRTNTDHALPDMPVPPVDEAYIGRLLRYAAERKWGQG